MKHTNAGTTPTGRQGQPNQDWEQCAQFPRKRIYRNLDRANKSAELASRKHTTVIEPKLCKTCGYYHLWGADPSTDPTVQNIHVNLWEDVDLTGFDLVTLMDLWTMANEAGKEVRVQMRLLG